MCNSLPLTTWGFCGWYIRNGKHIWNFSFSRHVSVEFEIQCYRKQHVVCCSINRVNRPMKCAEWTHHGARRTRKKNAGDLFRIHLSMKLVDGGLWYDVLTFASMWRMQSENIFFLIDNWCASAFGNSVLDAKNSIYPISPWNIMIHFMQVVQRLRVNWSVNVCCMRIISQHLKPNRLL